MKSWIKKPVIVILTLTLLLGGYLRFYRLSSVPVSLYWDETAIAFNAYSVLETGKDEYAKPFPLLFRSFDDYKTPGIVYLTTIPIWLFGLNEFSARFISAFLGTATILALFGLTYEIAKRYKEQNLAAKSKFQSTEEHHLQIHPKSLNENTLALLSALLFAISPWSLQFSRANFEANAGLFFVVSGFYLFFKGLRKNIWFLPATAMLGLSLYFYRSIQLVVPALLIIASIIFFRKLLSGNRIIIGLSILMFLALAMPIALIMYTPSGMVRYNQTTIFTFDQLDKKYYDTSQEILKHNNNPFARLIYNRRLVPIVALIQAYIPNWNPLFLFVDTNVNDRGSINNLGLLYAWQLPFFLLGLFGILRSKGSIKYFIIAWLAVATLPAALTTPPRNTLRNLNVLPMITLLSAWGIIYGVKLIKIQKQAYYTLRIVLVMFVGFFLYQYLNIYYNHWNLETAQAWGDGYKQANEYTQQHESEYQQIVISGHYWKPYVYTAFYSKFPPAEFQTNGSQHNFGKYVFGGVSWDGGTEFDKENLTTIAGDKKTLFILAPNEFYAHANILDTQTEIKGINKDVLFIAGTLK